MAYLHERPTPVVHGDLTSSNILLDRFGVAKVADFGIARYTLSSPNDDAIASFLAAEAVGRGGSAGETAQASE